MIWPAFASAASTAAVHCGAKPVRIAFYEYGYFFYDREQGLDGAQGIDKDIVEALERRSGCTFDRFVMARARIWAELESGGLDMSVSGARAPERDKLALFVPYLSMKNYAVLSTRSSGEVHKAEDFIARPALQFGVVRALRHGTAQDGWADKLRAAHRVQESVNIETVFRKLKDGRVDGLYAQPPVYRKFIEDLDLKDAVVVQDWAPDEKGVAHGLVLSRKRFDEKDAARWATLIREMRADGTLKKIFSRYLPPGEVTKMLEF